MYFRKDILKEVDGGVGGAMQKGRRNMNNNRCIITISGVEDRSRTLRKVLRTMRDKNAEAFLNLEGVKVAELYGR